MVPDTAVSARAAQPSEPDRRSIANERDRWLTCSQPHSPAAMVPQEQSAEPAARPWLGSEHLVGGQPTTWR
jgi:hypothetical protein